MNSNRRKIIIIAASLLAGLTYWILDGFYDYFFFEKTIQELIFHEPLSLWDALFINVPRDEIIARSSFAFASLMTGLVVILYSERVESGAARLRESESRARLLFENALAGLCSISSGGRLLAVNKAFARMIGFDSDPVDEETVGDFFSLNVWLSEPFQELVEKARTSSEPVVQELTIRDRVDEPLRVLLSLKSVVESNGEHRFELSSLDISGRYEAEKIQRSLSRRLVMIQEDERRHFSLELHDNLAQDIATLKLAAAGISDEDVGKDSPSMKNVVLCRRIIASLMVKVRAMMHSLKPYELSYVSLDEGIRNYLNNVMLNYGVFIDYNSSRLSLLNISLEAKIHLFRIVQEAVANAVRHAGDDRLTVNAVVDDGLLKFSIVDSGAGFDVEDHVKTAILSGQRGILGMRERADMLNVDLSIDSAPGRGTTVSVTAPIDRITDQD